jgi:hypothetical protein
MINVLITGSTGMIGKGVLLECLRDDNIRSVTLINRSAIDVQRPKIREILLKDFTQIESIKDQLGPIDACFHCMGISAMGLTEAQYDVLTFEVTQKLADLCFEHNPDMTFNYVSGTGTDSSEKGRVMWARVKGKTENYVLAKGFKRSFMFRPGFIIPENNIKSRTKLYNYIYIIFRPFFPFRLRHFVNMANMAKCSKLGEIIPKTMEQRFKSLSLFEFQERFSNAADCLKYLADEKWGNGFVCRKCGHTHSCAGKATQSRQCTCCRYVESPTAQTLFHKVKFDLLKAFYIVYFVSTNKKGITSTELSRKLNLRQKTCWGFKRKVMKAMESSENHPIEGDVEVDETVFGGQEENTKGRKNINKKLVVLAIEKKNKGVSRLYARVIPNASAEQLGGFMKAHIDPKAKITTDKWTGYIPLKADFENLTRVASGKKGSNFPELHRVVMNLKSWLRGVHHHVNDLQDYLNEYCYRFNRSFMKENIFDNLMKRMIEAEPCYIKNISQ